MAPIKEWRCLQHGPFEAEEGICPSGCDTVVREYRTAPGGRSPKTKHVDKTLQGLADRFGLSDMSNRDGSVGGSRKDPNAMAPLWGQMPKGNVYEVGKGERPVDGASGGATAALAGLGINAQNEASVQAIADAAGEKMPNFMDIAHSLPKVKPIAAASYGSSADLSKAIESAQ